MVRRLAASTSLVGKLALRVGAQRPVVLSAARLWHVGAQDLFRNTVNTAILQYCVVGFHTGNQSLGGGPPLVNPQFRHVHRAPIRPLRYRNTPDAAIMP